MEKTPREWFDEIAEGLSLLFLQGTPQQESVAVEAFLELCQLRAAAQGHERIAA